MSGLPTTYNQNVTPNPPGIGITVDGMLVRNATAGPTEANLLFANTITSGTPLVLTKADAQTYFLTGTTAQVISLLASNFVDGSEITINNQSSMPATVYYGTLFAPPSTIVPATYRCVFTCVNSAGGVTGWTAKVIAPSVIDSAATPTYPTDNAKGVWFGANTKANAFDDSAITIGNNANTDFTNSIAIGDGASAAGGVATQIALGRSTNVSGSSPTNNFGGIAVGSGSSAIASDSGGSITIGQLSSTTQPSSITIGQNVTTPPGPRAIRLGEAGTASGADSISVGTSSTATGTGSVVTSGDTSSSVAGNFAIVASGGGGSATGLRSISLSSYGGSVTGDYSVGIGRNHSIGAQNAIGIGHVASTMTPNTISLGTNNPLATASNALVLSPNAASITANGLGLTVNGVPRQLELYPTMYGSTQTSSSPIALTVNSPQTHFFTGTSDQDVILPDTTTLSNGFYFTFNNLSSGLIRIRTAAASAISVTTFVSQTFPTATIYITSVPANFPNSGTLIYNRQFINYTGVLFFKTAVSPQSNGTTPTFFISAPLADTFPSSGFLLVQTSNGIEGISYGGVGSITTNCVGNQTLPTSTINVVSTTGFYGNQFIITSTTGPVSVITWTSRNATQFLGCTGGTGSTLGAKALRLDFLSLSGGTGTLTTGNTIQSIALTGVTGGTGSIPSGTVLTLNVEPILVIQPGMSFNVYCTDASGSSLGWDYNLSGGGISSVSSSVPSLIIPNNYHASLKGVPIWGLYKSALNAASTATNTFTITGSFATTGLILTVATTTGVISTGMFVIGSTVQAGTYIVSQLTGTAGSTGTYNVSQSNNASLTSTYNISMSTANPDFLFVRTV